MRVLTAIPVYNEQAHLEPVLTEVLRHAGDVLVVDDGSTDRTPDLLRDFPDRPGDPPPAEPRLRRGPPSAFDRAIEAGYDGLVTIDCDGQHEPSLIPMIAARLDRRRHRLGEPLPPGLRPVAGPPEERRRINVEVTRWLNECLA